MIVVNLMGGLGNQLFQAAIGVILSNKNKMPLAFHFDDAYKIAKRNFALEPFCISSVIIEDKELKTYLPKKKFERQFYKLLGKNPNGKLVSEEKQFFWNENINTISTSCYLSGFWQSYRYFDNERQLILSQFSFKNEPVGENLSSYTEIIESKNAVSVHIRRGDYTNPDSGFYCLPLSYYQEALAHLEKEFGDLSIFVFSDDIEWAKSNLRDYTNIKFVSHNDGGTAHEDLRLMSACKFNIIANSSLSWWGAYLNTHTDKKVFAPKKWNQVIETNDVELLPKDWILI
jgi:hypothetical protein